MSKLAKRALNRLDALRSRPILFVPIFAVVGTLIIIAVNAATTATMIEPENGNLVNGATRRCNISTASGGCHVAFGTSSSVYDSNLAKIRAQPWRNRLEDNSPFKNTPMAQIDQNVSALYGPKSAYNDGFFEEQNLFADPGYGGFMRTGCEFSHFAYDDPILYPNQPEAAHLHMFFGNTDVNAYTTWESLRDSGAGTCNGGELNRTGYWVPAMFDQNGNVRVPHFLNIYYKNDNQSHHPNQPLNYYPDDSQIISPTSVSHGSNIAFNCINEYGGDEIRDMRYLDQTNCPGGWAYGPPGQPANNTYRYLEHNVIFQNCWNGQDPSNAAHYRDPQSPSNYAVPPDYWFGGNCPSSHPRRLPNLRYRIRYIVEPGDDTSKWWLASDVSKANGTKARAGSTNHGDWWGAWNKQVNKTWIDTCANVITASCGYGYLDGRTLEAAPNGPALKYRKKDPNLRVKIPAQDVYNSLCSHARPLQNTEQAAYCQPNR